MGKTVSLVAKREAPDADVVKLCKDLLAHAESGELRGLAVVTSLTESNVGQSVADSAPLAMLGMLELLKLHLVGVLTDNAEE